MEEPVEMITMIHNTSQESNHEKEDLETQPSSSYFSSEVDFAQMPLPELSLLVELKELCYEVSVAVTSKNFFKPPTTSKKAVFQNLNLQVIPDEFLAIMGPSGCRKTSS